jgi:hypothetical protein
MSGIISSAGSKSGVIGTTELDYEEGTWTPGQGGEIDTSHGSFSWSAAGTYTKIGRTVILTASIGDYVGMASGDRQYCTGLPFTPSTEGSGTARDGTRLVSSIVTTAGATIYSTSAIAISVTMYISITYTTAS